MNFVFCMLSHVFYNCEKFHNYMYIAKGSQLTERTHIHARNGYVQCSKGNNSKSSQTRGTVHVFCTSSHSAFLILLRTFVKLSRTVADGADTNDGSADGRTLKFFIQGFEPSMC